MEGMAAACSSEMTGIGLISGTGLFVRETVGGGFLGMPEEYARFTKENKVVIPTAMTSI